MLHVVGVHSFFSFFLLYIISLYKYTMIFHSAVDGHLDCFQFLVVTDKDARNFHVRVFDGHILIFLSDNHPTVQWYDQCLLKKPSNYLPKFSISKIIVLFYFTSPPGLYDNSTCSPPTPNLVWPGLFNFSCSNRCAVVCHHSFNLLMTNDVEHCLSLFTI